MKARWILYAGMILLNSCERNQMSDNQNNLPDGWVAGEGVSHEQSYVVPPLSGDPAMQQFYAARGDEAYRLYHVPTDTSIREIVEFFRVGAHGAMSYGLDEEKTIELVAGKAAKVAELIPCRLIFADQAGLKLQFERPVSDEEVAKLETMFPMDSAFETGMARYLTEWSGEGSYLAPVKEENQLHFWWD
ncbi:hypothetical protein Rhal01_02114 [Rubritalea halochordaticola]|uniref:DUF4253 domain-containing protein n=1 Tax=Rubritalea halochordaticola TaxID=714537 RepID=A0ABP9UZR7_9BACT